MTRSEEITNKDGFYISWAGDLPANGAKIPVIFTANRPCEVIDVRLRSETGYALDAYLSLAKNTVAALGSGAYIVNLSLYSLANSTDRVYDADDFKQCATDNSISQTVYDSLFNWQLKAGDRLEIWNAGTNDVSQAAITVYLKPLNKGDYR